jgi:hypothetical protein
MQILNVKKHDFFLMYDSSVTDISGPFKTGLLSHPGDIKASPWVVFFFFEKY